MYCIPLRYMIIIADSGSTKTSWALSMNNERHYAEGPGMHPGHIDIGRIHQYIPDEVVEWHNSSTQCTMKFFGSGCLHDSMSQMMKHALLGVFPHARIEVQSDLAGAAYATLGNRPGIIAILGTGSSAARWSGHSLLAVSPSLGYILGDEGSGADLGKELLAQVFHHILPQSLIDHFHLFETRIRHEILREIYQSAHPGKELARYVAFLQQCMHDPAIEDLIMRRFDLFFDRQIMPLYQTHDQVCIAGGVAGAFSEMLVQEATNRDVDILKILPSPIHGLIDYFGAEENV